MNITRKKIYSAVATALKTAYTGIQVSDERKQIPASFPAVWILETRTASWQTQTTDLSAKFERSMFELQVFSNKSIGAVNEMEDIVGTAESTLHGQGYIKTMQSTIDNAEPDIRRMVARFERLIGDSDILNVI